MPGQFHTSMNYIVRLTGYKYRGSGYSKILIEAVLVTSGCLNSVLKGKSYDKALFCLKTVTKAMERLLIERFVIEEEVEINSPVALLGLFTILDLLPPSLSLRSIQHLKTRCMVAIWGGLPLYGSG